MEQNDEEGADMEFKFAHNSFNVLDMGKSLAFYKDALGLKEMWRREAEDGSFVLVFLGDGQSAHQLELTWLRDHAEPYALGECEYHLAFQTENLEGARTLHKEMGCVCFENQSMGIYFINDPDGYWIEIVPAR
jgi:lactoylglutathione lyase